MVFVLVLVSLLFPVSVLVLVCICNEIRPLNSVSSVSIELLMVSNSPDIQFLVFFILFLFCVVISRIWLLSCSVCIIYIFTCNRGIKNFHYFTCFSSNACLFFFILVSKLCYFIIHFIDGVLEIVVHL